METHKGLEQAQAFIQCHVRPPPPATRRPKLAVTISREVGSGAWLVARELAVILDRRAPREDVKWTVFDKELVSKVLTDHHLPDKLAEYMPEDRVSLLEDMVTELLGLHPPSWDLYRATAETILKLAELGHVILIGRGANVVTARLPHVLHVRLVGSHERRVQRVMEMLKLDRKAALEFMEKADRGRMRYLREHFKADINDPLQYDLIINPDRIACEQAAQLVADALLRRAGLAG
jgi:cytidylate kinase